MGKDVSDAAPEDAGAILSGAMVELMQKVGMPNGLKAVVMVLGTWTKW